MIALPQPCLLFVGDTTQREYAKTAFGLPDWAGDKCVGEWASSADAVTTGLARMTPAEAADKGARALVIAVANAPIAARVIAIETVPKPLAVGCAVPQHRRKAQIRCSNPTASSV